MKKTLLIFIATFLFSFEVKKFVTCKNVINLTPVEITDTFDVNDSKVYAFAYLTDIKENKNIDFIWEKEVNGEWRLYTDVSLPIYTGPRWRTYSYIKIRPYFVGNWRVSLFDGNKTIKTLYFKIKDNNVSSQNTLSDN
jgi:hypothetical protein